MRILTPSTRGGRLMAGCRLRRSRVRDLLPLRRSLHLRPFLPCRNVLFRARGRVLVELVSRALAAVTRVDAPIWAQGIRRRLGSLVIPRDEGRRETDG